MSCRNYFLFWKNKNTLTESFHTSHQGNPNWSTGPILDTQSEKIMQEMGLEPTRSCDHRHLKPARLPIPPLLHFLVCLSGCPLDKIDNNSFLKKSQHLFWKNLNFFDFMKNMDNSDNFKQFYTVWDSSVFLSPSAHLLRTEIKRPCRKVFTLPIRAIRIGPPDQFLIRKVKK